MKSILVYKQDKWNFVWTFLGPLFIIIPFIVGSPNIFLNTLIWIIVWIAICRHNYILHNHVHSPITRFKPLNKLLDILLGFCTGMPAGNWKIMHVHGHHVEHKIEDLKSRSFIKKFVIPEDNMGGVLFSLRRMPAQFLIPITILIKSLLSKSKRRRKWAIYYLADYILIVAAIFMLAYVNYLMVIFFILPMYFLISFVSLYIDYYSHIQPDTEEKNFVAFSNVCHHPLYNKLFWNFGYHVAHHSKPNAHWSELPTVEQSLGVSSSPIEAYKALNIFGVFRPKYYSWKVPKWLKTKQ